METRRVAGVGTGLLFPGQGSQFAGMGRRLARAHRRARETFEEADDVLGFALSRLAWEGPDAELTRTENAQPALYAHSLAIHRVVADRLGPVAAAAGHSLGELSAHAAAGTFSFADGLRAVRKRGLLMAAADEAAPGGMAALLGMADEAVAALCAEATRAGMVLVPANLNAKGQIVASGDVAGVEWALRVARERGARKAVPLKVSAAFHSPLMAPAAEAFAAHLAQVRFRRPAFPVASNATARLVEDPEEIPALLVRQLASPVRWMDCIARMTAMGIDDFAELGPGKVLTTLNRRNARGARTRALGTLDAVEAIEE